MRQQVENDKLLQDPRVAALLKAIDDAPITDISQKYLISIKAARAAFDPPVEMEYTMPSWDVVVLNTGGNSYFISNAEYSIAREVTKRPKPKQEKLGQEWWVNSYPEGSCSIWSTERKAKTFCNPYCETIRVREVLE